MTPSSAVSRCVPDQRERIASPVSGSAICASALQNTDIGGSSQFQTTAISQAVQRGDYRLWRVVPEHQMPDDRGGSSCAIECEERSSGEYRADTKPLSLALVQQYYADLRISFQHDGNAPASCSRSISGVNALRFRRAINRKVAMKPLRWRSMVPLFMVTSLVENRGFIGLRSSARQVGHRFGRKCRVPGINTRGNFCDQ